MRVTSKLLPFALLLMLSSLVGCGSEFPSVSGVVTFDGKPVSNVRVTFSPQRSGDSVVVGAPSFGMTDENGNYSLKSRNGRIGAVVGTHKVGFDWGDIKAGSVPSLTQAWKALPEKKSSDAVEIKKLLDDIKQKLASRPKLPENVQVTFEVTPDGSSEANFELNDL